MNLNYLTTKQLIDELKKRSEVGIVYVENPDRDEEDEWYCVYRWGDRLQQIKALSDTLRIVAYST